MELKMNIRKVEEKDIPQVLNLLLQVLEIHRQGVGEALLKYVNEYAKSRDCQELTLNSWADNDPANNFYKKMGLKVRASTFEYLL